MAYYMWKGDRVSKKWRKKRLCFYLLTVYFFIVRVYYG